jgi:CubicO group peptidase (beta-lactamase class C family)
MFAHRSGLPDHAGDVLEDIGYGRDEVTYRLRFLQPASSFRSEYAYTNFGLTAGAVAAAHAAGRSWEDVSAERLYQPLGMAGTSSRHADFFRGANRASGHTLVDGRWVAGEQRDPDAQSPAGGVSSSAHDMAQWMRLQLAGGRVDGRQVIAAAALAETHRPQTVRVAPANPATDRAGFYGLGWNVDYDAEGRVRLTHSGGFLLGAGTAVTLLPGMQLGIVTLTNAAPIGVAESVSASFFDLVDHGTLTRDWLGVIQPAITAAVAPPYGKDADYSQQPAGASSPHPSESYAGLYRNDFVGDAQVVQNDGHLSLLLGPSRISAELRHWDGDVFLYQPVGENAGGLSRVVFLIGEDGTARQVTIENLDLEQAGTLTRVPAAS